MTFPNSGCGQWPKICSVEDGRPTPIIGRRGLAFNTRGTGFQSSLRDLDSLADVPGAEAPGYWRDAPPGLGGGGIGFPGIGFAGVASAFREWYRLCGSGISFPGVGSGSGLERPSLVRSASLKNGEAECRAQVGVLRLMLEFVSPIAQDDRVMEWTTGGRLRRVGDPSLHSIAGRDRSETCPSTGAKGFLGQNKNRGFVNPGAPPAPH